MFRVPLRLRNSVELFFKSSYTARYHTRRSFSVFYKDRITNKVVFFFFIIHRKSVKEDWKCWYLNEGSKVQSEEKNITLKNIHYFKGLVSCWSQRNNSYRHWKVIQKSILDIKGSSSKGAVMSLIIHKCLLSKDILFTWDLVFSYWY